MDMIGQKGKDGKMFRKFKIILSGFLFIVGMLLVSVNVSTFTTVIGLGVALISLRSLFVLTRGNYTGFLQDLNGDVESAKQGISNLLSNAERSVKILTGYLEPHLYFDEKVFKSLMMAKEKICIEIIMGDPKVTLDDIKNAVPKERFEEFVSSISAKKISVMKAKKRQMPHFMIIDDHHLRVEDKHPWKKIGDPLVEERKAIISYFDVPLAKKYEKTFSSIKKHASPIN